MTRHTFQNHILERAVDLLLDVRLPHAASYRMWKARSFTHLTRELPKLNEPLQVCLTFDVEHDYRDPGSIDASRRFMPRYLEWATSKGWQSTFYVQGSLIPELSEILRQAECSHEIGLHGLHHEVWGRSRWWQYNLGFVGLSREEKQDRLQQALTLFDRANLKRPRSFRAPYLNIDRATRRILAGNGFVSDSSASTYLGVLPVAFEVDGMWEVPVTSNPIPQRIGFSARYLELSLGSLFDMSADELSATISFALQLQLEKGSAFPPHIVLLAHPWEFESNPRVSYASEGNLERLHAALDSISSPYQVEFTTISRLVSHGNEDALLRALSVPARAMHEITTG